MRLSALTWALPVAVLTAQVPSGPVVQPRGVVNAFTQQPAPSITGQGGIIHINGINLAPPEGWKAGTLPLPTEFGSPATQVLINNRPAPLVEATPTRITAQVPFETAAGVVNVIVRRGQQQSRVARITVQNLAPSILSANGKGYGAVANSGTAPTIRLSATSLGQAEPALRTGEAPTDTATPRAAIRAYVGGIPVEAATSASSTTPGIYMIDIQTPATARPGDLITIGENAAEANLVTLATATAPSELIYIPYPDGTPDLRNLRSSDLDGLFLNANAVRASDNCYPGFTVDARAKSLRKVDGCLTAAQAQAATPFVDGTSSPYFASFAGPTKVKIFSASKPDPVDATLPESAAVLTSQAGGTFIASVPASAGNPAKNYRIDSQTGEVEEFTPANPGGAAGGNLQGLLNRFQNIDLGDGINRLLSPISQVNNQIVLTAGDSADNPTKAKVAVLNLQGDILAQRDFPAGWLPIVAPAPANPPQGPQQQFRTPTPIYSDAQSRSYYVAVRNPDGRHGLAYFPTEGDSQIIAVPDNWFFAACMPNIPVFALELTRGVALLGASVDDRAFKNPCPAEGFLLLDLATRKLDSVNLPGSGKFNASGGADELNDFLTGANFDPANRNTSDTFYALDGVNSTVFRFDLPAGVNGFSGAQRIPALNIVIAQANNRVAGDSGLVIFDLERTESRLLPTPEGFAAVNFLGVLPSIRRLVARGVKAGNSGTQLLVYNLETGDLEIVPNPDGIAWLGSPVQQQQPGQAIVNLPPRLNAKTNSVEALAFGEDRRQKGIIVIRVN